MMITQRKMKRVLSGVLAALPALPYVMRSRRRTSIAAYVLGGVSVALAGGIAAVMLLSPRTRNRALVAARGTYDKVNDTISQIRSHRADGLPMSNGLVDRGEYSTEAGQ
jgi:hypothetical protein